MQVNIFPFEHADEKQTRPWGHSSPREWERYGNDRRGGGLLYEAEPVGEQEEETADEEADSAHHIISERCAEADH
jgi:hypothetical protein